MGLSKGFQVRKQRECFLVNVFVLLFYSLIKFAQKVLIRFLKELFLLVTLSDSPSSGLAIPPA